MRSGAVQDPTPNHLDWQTRFLFFFNRATLDILAAGMGLGVPRFQEYLVWSAPPPPHTVPMCQKLWPPSGGMVGTCFLQDERCLHPGLSLPVYAADAVYIALLHARPCI